jgi:uncharacterized repeat protein (TIGR01451 family)
MFARRFLWVAGISLAACLVAFGALVAGLHLHTARVLAGWQQARSSLTGPLRTFPPQGEDTFLSSTTLGFAPLCNLQALSSVVAEGPTTIQRQEPVTLPDGREQIETEMVQLDLRGSFEMGPLVGPVTIRESPDRRTKGKVTQIKPGQDFPAESFFDVFFEVDVDLGGIVVTLINHEPVPMRRIITSIPPVWADYLPPPNFLAHLYDKATGAYWGCMIHPKHLTKPPIVKPVSIPDPGMDSMVNLTIQIENPLSEEAIPVYLVDRLYDPLSAGSFVVMTDSLQAEPGEVYLRGHDQLVWENDADPGSLDPVILEPRHQAAITFTAQIYAMPGRALPNVVEVWSPPIGLYVTQPMTLTWLMPGGLGNLTKAGKDAQPFVAAGGKLTYTVELPNSGVVGMAHASLFDPIPPGTTYVPGSVGGGASYDPARNAIVLYDAPIPPGETQLVHFQVKVDMLLAGTCITNTAIVTDNWGNRYDLDAWTVVVNNHFPAMLIFEWQRDTYRAGSVAPVRVRVVDRQGVNTPDGTAVTLSSSGGILSPPSGTTLLTHNGLVTATLASDIVQTVVITAETGPELLEMAAFHFVYGGYLPLVVKNWR